MMNNPRYTIDEIAMKLGIPSDITRGLVRFLVAADLAYHKGKRPVTGRGVRPDVFEFREDYETMLEAMLKEAKLTR